MKEYFKLYKKYFYNSRRIKTSNIKTFDYSLSWQIVAFNCGKDVYTKSFLIFCMWCVIVKVWWYFDELNLLDQLVLSSIFKKIQRIHISILIRKK
jgi:hypothetical protein